MLMNGFQGSVEGVELPALTDPATAADIQSGKQAVSQDGVKLTGTLPLLDEYTSGGTPTVVGSGSLTRLQIGCRARSDMILRYMTPIAVNTLLTNLGDAAASEVLSGKTFTSTAGWKVTGTHQCPTLESMTSDATAAAGDLLSGKTAYVNGEKLTGGMANQGAKTAALNAGGFYTIPAGYHNGSGQVTANSLSAQTSATAVAADLKSGKTAWVNGTKITGTAAVFTTQTVESPDGTIYESAEQTFNVTVPAGYMPVDCYLSSDGNLDVTYSFDYAARKVTAEVYNAGGRITTSLVVECVQSAGL